MSRRAVHALLQFGEVNLFLRGIVPMLGFPSDIVCYERRQRMAGETKYPVKKMVEFAVKGVTSLSTKPIQMLTKSGIMMVIISIGMLIWRVVQCFCGKTVVGWTSMLCSIWFIGGVIVFFNRSCWRVCRENIFRVKTQTQIRYRENSSVIGLSEELL